MMNFLLLTFLLLAVFVNATPVTRTEVHSFSCRSEEYLTRQQRQSPFFQTCGMTTGPHVLL